MKLKIFLALFLYKKYWFWFHQVHIHVMKWKYLNFKEKINLASNISLLISFIVQEEVSYLRSISFNIDLKYIYLADACNFVCVNFMTLALQFKFTTHCDQNIVYIVTFCTFTFVYLYYLKFQTKYIIYVTFIQTLIRKSLQRSVYAR